jgi:sulfate transport system substrate-binding protein
MKKLFRLSVAALALSASAWAPAQTLLNASYDVAREFYKDYNAAFIANYKKTTGKDVKIDQSHGGSSAQARAVNDGLDADVVTMNTTTDVDFLASTGMVAKDWAKRFPNNARPPRPPCCSWCATATPRASRTGTTWSSPACR